MTDIVLDTDILAELLGQYYQRYSRGELSFQVQARLHRELVGALNRIVRWHTHIDWTEEVPTFPGLIVASSLAFVEIARQFDEIVRGRFTIEQFAAFIEQPPEWFHISPVDSTLFPFLRDLPSEVTLADGARRPLEWADAIHIATATSRGEICLLAVTDQTVKQLEMLKGRLI